MSREPLLPKSVTCLPSFPRTGSTFYFYSPGLESTPQLCNENRVLRRKPEASGSVQSHFQGWEGTPKPLSSLTTPFTN